MVLSSLIISILTIFSTNSVVFCYKFLNGRYRHIQTNILELETGATSTFSAASKIFQDKISKPDIKQLDAIESKDQAVLLIAGAGSGKTRVLSSRLAYLLMSGICSPSEVLILSFSNNAANNLKARADYLLEDSVATTTGVTCSTFHGFCSEVLRKHIFSLSRRKDLVIADEDDQMRIILDLLRYRGSSTHRSHAYDILKQIRYWKELGLGYIGIRKSSLKSVVEKEAYDLYPDYQSKLRSVSASDFGDLLLFTFRLFRQYPHILEQYRREYKHIIVDEFQDVSPAQYDILRMLCVGPPVRTQSPLSSVPFPVTTDGARDRGSGSGSSADTSFGDVYANPEDPPPATSSLVNKVNVFCAGDDDQAIHAWGGTQVDLMRRFRFDFPGAKVIRFSLSYRVPTQLCNAALSVVSSLPDRIPKLLHSIDHTGNEDTVKYFGSSNSMQSSSNSVSSQTPTYDDHANTEPFTNVFYTSQEQINQVRGSLEVRHAATEVEELLWLSSYLHNCTVKHNMQSYHSHTQDILARTPYRNTYCIAVLVRTQRDLKRVTEELTKRKLSFRTRGYGARILPSCAEAPLNLLRSLSAPKHDIAFQSALDNDIILSSNDYNLTVFINNVLPIVRELAKEEKISLLESCGKCLITKRLQGPYAQSLERFIIKYDGWQNDIIRYFRSGDIARKLLYNILRSAYGRRWNPSLEEAVEDICHTAASFDSLQHFISVVRQEGEFVVEDSVSAFGPESEKEEEVSWATWKALHLDSYDVMGGDAELLRMDMPDMRLYRAMGWEDASGINSFNSQSIDVDAVLQEPSSSKDNTAPWNAKFDFLTADAMSGPPKVSLWVMTMHAAKGMEFDEVILPFWVDGSIPSTSSPDEERRIAYVALTRARERVLISFADSDMLSSRRNEKRIISPILVELLAKIQPNIQIVDIQNDELIKFDNFQRNDEIEDDEDGNSQSHTPKVAILSDEPTDEQFKNDYFDPAYPTMYGIQRMIDDRNQKRKDVKKKLRAAIALNPVAIKRGRIPIYRKPIGLLPSPKEEAEDDEDKSNNRREKDLSEKPLSRCSVEELANYLLSLPNQKHNAD